MDNTEIGKASSGDIATMKDSNPRGVFEIRINNSRNGNIHFAYFKKPGRQQMDFASAEASKGGKFSVDRFNQSLFNNCWIGGDEKVKTDEDLFLAATTQFGELSKVFDTEIKEL
jgi:hypothetical protein